MNRRQIVPGGPPPPSPLQLQQSQSQPPSSSLSQQIAMENANRVWKRELDDDNHNMLDTSNGSNGGNYLDNGAGNFNPSDGNSYGNSGVNVFSSQPGQTSPACDFQNSSRSKTPKYAPSPSPSEPSIGGQMQQQNMNNVGYPQNTGGFPFNGPHPGSPGGPFGSPSSSSCPPFSRPYSAGPVFSGNGPSRPARMGSQYGSPVGGGGGFPGGPGGPGGPYGGGGGMPPSGGFPLMGGNMPQTIDRMDQGLRKHNSPVCHTEHRIFELNMRIQQRTEDTDNSWWDSFATEFFEDDARLTILFCLEDGPKRYTIGRTLIPRFFRSIFEGGVSDLYFQMQHAKESFHNTLITLDCDHCTIMTQHGEPFYTKVCADARLILEFLYDDYMRIKSWHMTIKGHREMIPRSVVATSMATDPVVLEQISKNITRSGITNATLNYLRLCDILEPMQELMSRHKAFELSPRDCLKTTLFQKWQRMVAPTNKKDPQKPATKKRKRKAATPGGGGGRLGAKTPNAVGQKRSPSRSNFPLAFQDVMVVGEPTLMGGEVGEEDERLITRLNNTQYDVANPMDHDNHQAFNSHAQNSPMGGGGLQQHNSWKHDRGGIPQSPGGSGVAGLHGNNMHNQDMDKKSPSVL